MNRKHWENPTPLGITTEPDEHLLPQESSAPSTGSTKELGMFNELKVGDTVTRMLAGVVPMRLKVTDLTDSRIVCGAWEFDRDTGIEIDDDIDCQVSHLVPNAAVEPLAKPIGSDR